jgi:integrating conjugative element relaxase (TIGR03760 family)
MFSWFSRPVSQVQTATLPSAKDGYVALETADTLLAAAHRRQLLDRIWQYTALSSEQFATLYLRPLRRYAIWVQQLPASETHHHAYLGGMLDHGLELMACSLKLRQSYLLPTGAAPEDQAAQTDAWSAAIAYGALLHDIGKIAVDLTVERQDGGLWHPWHGPLEQAYRFRYLKGRDYHLHDAAAGLLYTQILDHHILDWLSGFPVLWANLLYLLAGQYERAGVLGEIVLQADRISTAQNIGANPAKALQAPAHSLQHHLLTGLRQLVQHELKLNQPGAAGWLTEEALWLVSKTVTDKLRAHLLAQSIEGIPSSNIAVFDELQSHGLIETTPNGKAVWKVQVIDGDWEKIFTVLRLQPTLIWGNEERPVDFGGAVEILLKDKAPVDEVGPLGIGGDTSRILPADQDVDLGALLGLFDGEPPAIDDRTEPVSVVPTTSNAEHPGQAFLDWVSRGIRDHTLVVNDSRAQIHTVDGSFFLVSPGLFQRYVQAHPDVAKGTNGQVEEWIWVQRQFEKLNTHRQRGDGLNIWTCQVKGPRKTAVLNGYLLASSETILTRVPKDNPFLSLINVEFRATES